MAERITQADLDRIASRLTSMTGKKHYIQYAYGKAQLQVEEPSRSGPGTGARNVTRMGTKREIYELGWTYIYGLEDGRQLPPREDGE